VVVGFERMGGAYPQLSAHRLPRDRGHVRARRRRPYQQNRPRESTMVFACPTYQNLRVVPGSGL
jgi:hypothetical protein